MKTLYSILCFVLFCSTGFTQSTSDYEAILSDYFEADGPGATAIVTKGDKVLYRGAIGMANIELDLPMKPEYIFRIGSITKQFTAVAILKLQEEGKLSISDPITRFLPDYPTGGHDITIEHLLTHTSGIQSYTDIPGWMATKTRIDRTLAELIDEFKDHPMNFDPGDEWRYNNSGYILLGAIIEAASGLSYEVYMQSEIFDPIGLSSTHYGDHLRIIENRIPGYAPGGRTGVQNAEFLSMTLPHAAGSILSNVDDLAKWNKAIHASKLVSNSTLQSAFEPYILSDGSDSGYGFGWQIAKIGGETTYEHGGGIHGFLTSGIYSPSEDVYVAVLSNCNCNPPGNAALRMAALAVGYSFEFSEIDVDATTLQQYVGVYDIEDSEDMRSIIVDEGKLYSKRGNGQRFEVTPYARDKFYYADSFTKLEFVRGKDGKVKGQNVTPRTGVVGYASKTDKIPEGPKPTVAVTPKVLDMYVGNYELMPGLVLSVIREGNALIGQATGQGRTTLKASSDTEFFVEEIGAELEFVVEDGECKKLILKQGGQTIEGKRVDD